MNVLALLLTTILTTSLFGYNTQNDVQKSILAVAQNPFYIPAEQVQSILAQNPDLTIDDLMVQLVSIAKMYARPPLSNYKVGVVGLGASGSLYLGVNLEFPSLPLCVHGEQFMTINARNHGEEYIQKIALAAAPCGFCRQFLNEIGQKAPQIAILTPANPPTTLGALLPEAFGPQDLGLTGGLLSPTTPSTSTTLEERAKEALVASYAPYTNCQAGVSIQTSDGMIFSGSYLENAAFNPAVTPLASALVDLVSHEYAYSDIEAVVLAENSSCPVQQNEVTLSILNGINPYLQYWVVKVP